MASIQITVPDALVPRLREAMRARFPDLDGLTDAQAFKKATADYWRGVLAEHEATQAESLAWQQSRATVEAAKVKAESDGEGIG